MRTSQIICNITKMPNQKQDERSIIHQQNNSKDSAQTDFEYSLQGLVRTEVDRYRRKGVAWAAFSVVQSIAYFNFIAYMGQWIWPKIYSYIHVHQIAEWKFQILFSWFISISTLTMSNLFFYILYKSSHPIFEQYKILKNQQWPWQEDPVAWRELLYRSFKSISINNFVIVPSFLLLGAYLNNFQAEFSYSPEELPSVWTFVWQSYYWIVFEDVIFCISHRTLHRPWFYKPGEHAHPVEFIMGNILPLFIPGLILGKRVHFFTFMVIACHRIIAATTEHSGYDLPIKLYEILPFRSDSRYHDYHHAGNINGNYGASVVLSDFIMGYNHQYFRHLDTVVYKDKGTKKLD
ncbi:hypothetical protein FGO68_gene7179 [Halteria grandinella]|uniref:Fatty acid hydroxylase domain-containing protein n=1 Tax=Halteria grandinella TaxID=5974 RepID=A0A8J8NLU0_HALGN|nr:hypothetical protein FGO68_gene7179 [Halteria grandinella]